jgi:hypothetical protein
MMPTFKLSLRTRLRLRWEAFKQALDIGGEPARLMGMPDRSRRSIHIGRLARPPGLSASR